MKTIIFNDKVVKLYTIRDLADALGVERVKFWKQVRGDNPVMPQPTYKLGQREYYTEKMFRKLVALHRPKEEAKV